MKDYENITGFVSVEELEEVTDENNGGAPWIPILATVAFTVKVATAVVCETGACTGYCR